MSNLEDHARDIRRVVAALRDHAIERTHDAGPTERYRAFHAAEALEDAIMRTLPMLGMDPLVREVDDASLAFDVWLDEDR